MPNGRVVIKTPIGYVAGVNEEHQIVQVTSLILHAKTFSSAERADKWMSVYSGIGYGFDRRTATIHPFR